LEAIDKMASKKKPIILATGASSIEDVDRAVDVILRHQVPLSILQCNTNYTGDASNFAHIHLNVLKTYRHRFPNAILGLSDHTPGDSTVLGAVALGGRIIEKHFTDDTTREGPDHHFSMTTSTWRDMVERTRELEAALGIEAKTIAANEHETSILQRRALRFARPMRAGDAIGASDIVALRPAPSGSMLPFQKTEVVGRSLQRDVDFHDLVFPEVFLPAG